jgi:threonine-phosphate decarboxylase
MLYQKENPHGGDKYGKQVKYDFSVNVNPLGVPKHVQDAILSALPRLAEYPDPHCRALVSALSRHEQVLPEEIICGNGASELIYAYCRAARPKRALLARPTFSGYETALETVGCQVFGYGLKRENDFALDGGILEMAKEIMPDAVFLCNPNNPTGRLIAPELLEEILRFCSEHGVRLFVDECFLDLTDSGESLAPRLRENPCLFLLKSFTKSFALAGLRLGYALCADGALMKRAAETTGPWNVSVLAQAAGIAALDDGAELERTRKFLSRERARLFHALSQLCAYVCPTDANFLLFEDGPGLCEAMLRCRILIRDCGNFAGLDGNWYRAAVLDKRANSELIRVMRQLHERG